MISYIDNVLRRTVNDAVKAYTAKVDAEEKREQYKRLQNSSQFARVGALGRNMLDNTGKDLKEKVKEHSNDLERLLKSLKQLPEMSANFLDLSARVEEQKIMDYIREVKEWIESTRPLVLKLTTASPVAPAVPTDASPVKGYFVEDGQIDDVHPSPTKRRRAAPPDSSPATDLFARLTHAEYRIEEIYNILNRGKSSPELQQMIDDTIDSMWAVKMGSSASSNRQLSNRADELGNRVMSEAEDVASMLTLRGRTELELKAMREEHQQLLQQQAQVYITCFTTVWKLPVTDMYISIAQSQGREAAMQKELDQNSALMQRMEQQMQQLLAQRQDPAFHLAEATRSQIGTIACETITQEVEPAMTHFKFAVEGHINGQHRLIYQTLWEKLEPSLQLTERIYQWFNSQVQMQKQVA
jgi:hypothetical protein